MHGQKYIKISKCYFSYTRGHSEWLTLLKRVYKFCAPCGRDKKMIKMVTKYTRVVTTAYKHLNWIWINFSFAERLLSYYSSTKLGISTSIKKYIPHYDALNDKFYLQIIQASIIQFKVTLFNLLWDNTYETTHIVASWQKWHASKLYESAGNAEETWKPVKTSSLCSRQ